MPEAEIAEPKHDAVAQGAAPDEAHDFAFEAYNDIAQQLSPEEARELCALVNAEFMGNDVAYTAFCSLCPTGEEYAFDDKACAAYRLLARRGLIEGADTDGGFLFFDLTGKGREVAAAYNSLQASQAEQAHPGRFGGIVGRGSATVQDLAHGRIAPFPEESAINGFLALRAREEGLMLKTSPLQTRAYEDVGFVRDETTYMVRPYQHAVRTVKGDGVSIVGLVDGEGRAVEVELRVFWRKEVGLSPIEREFVGMVMRLYGAGGRADAHRLRGGAVDAGAGRRAFG